MCYTKNKSLYLDVVKNGQMFPSEVTYYRLFSVEKWGALKAARNGMP